MIKRNSVRAAFIFTILFGSFHCMATTRSSGTREIISNIAISIQFFIQNHNNQLPSSWEELNAYTPLGKFSEIPIADYFTYIPNSPPSEELKGARVVIVGRESRPELNQQDVGRFIVFRTKEGDILFDWYPEEKVQKIIAETHIVIPPPTVTPPATTDSQVQENNSTPPSQTAFPESTSSVPATPLQTPKPIAEVIPASDTSIPFWIYGIILLSVGCIGGLWFLFLREKK